MYGKRDDINKEDVVNKYLAGMTIPKISKVYNCHYRTIKRILVSNGVYKKDRIDLEDVIDKYSSNQYTVQEIGDMYYCSYRTIRNRLKNIGIDKKKTFNPKNRYKDMVPSQRRAKVVEPIEIRGDNELYEFVSGWLHGELRKIYWEFYYSEPEITKYLNLAYGRLLKMPGPKRASELRKNQKLKEYYRDKINGLK